VAPTFHPIAVGIYAFRMTQPRVSIKRKIYLIMVSKIAPLLIADGSKIEKRDSSALLVTNNHLTQEKP
jgi:hypothetical protein